MENEKKKKAWRGSNAMAIPGLCSQRKTINMNMIENCVLDHFDMNSESMKEALRSKSRETKLTHYRHLVFFFAYKFMNHLSVKQIGLFYNRDHATVTHAKNKILGMSKVYSLILESVNQIDESIKSYGLPIPDEKQIQVDLLLRKKKKQVLAFTERVAAGKKISETTPAKYKGKKKGKGVSKWLDFIKHGQ